MKPTQRPALHRLFTLFLFTALCLQGIASAQGPALDAFIERQMQRAHVPGLAAGIVRDGELVWSSGYGYAHVKKRTPVTPDTIFMLASISKTITGTAVLQLHDDGILDLDADINTWLPFDVRHGRHPARKITARQLLTHTSGIRDDDAQYDAYSRGDSEISLHDFLREYLHPQGDQYHRRRNFAPWQPGKRYEYSNTGYALLGLLVESATGQDFNEFCKERLFAPLNMQHTSWRLADLPRARIAMPYAWRGGRYRAYGHYGYPDYPNGLLRTSVTHLARFAAMHLNDGTWQGERLLEPSTAQEMRRVQRPAIADDMGLSFFTEQRGGLRLVGHDGGDDGVSTQMWLSPERGLAVILLTNGDALANREEAALQRVLNRLIAVASSQP